MNLIKYPDSTATVVFQFRNKRNRLVSDFERKIRIGSIKMPPMKEIEVFVRRVVDGVGGHGDSTKEEKNTERSMKFNRNKDILWSNMSATLTSNT